MDELFEVEPTPAEIELAKLRACQVLVDEVLGEVIFKWKEIERQEREAIEKEQEASEDPDLLEQLREHILGPLQEDLKEAQVLYGKENPEKQPFKYKYEARDLFHKQETWFKEWIMSHGEKMGPRQHHCASQARALLHHLLGVNYIDCEELATGAEFLERSHVVLSEAPRTFFSELIQMDNHLGILWSKRGEFRKAKIHLDEAEALFKKYSAHAQDVYDPKNPVSVLLKFVATDIDVAHTHTLFYLAQVFGALGNNTKSAWYCHYTLSRQMSTGKYIPLDWAENTADLSNYYVNMKDYEQAFACLHAAKTILPVQAEEVSQAKLAATFTEFYVDMLRTSAEFAILAMQGRPVPTPVKLNRELTFHGITAPPAPKLATNFEQARELFKSGTAWAKIALEYYVLDGFVTDHVKLQQAQSTLYRFLYMFEQNTNRKSAMAKRRIAILEPLVEAIHSHHYYGVWKQLGYELAETYSGLADLWSDARTKDSSVCSLKKINDFTKRSVEVWEQFIKSFEKNGELPDDIDPDYVHSFLTGHFFAGRLLTKIIATDVAGSIANLNKAIKMFTGMIGYVEAHQINGLENEVAVAKEMLSLLPVKIQAIESGRLAHDTE